MAIVFNSKSSDFGWLSNFSEHSFKVDEVQWASVEHFYQAAKYLEPDVTEEIRKAASPLRARKIGQNRALIPRSDWSEVKEEVMRRAIHAKFQQNRKLRGLLLATGDEDLVHKSETDRFWGQNQYGEGENRLGLIIMDVRQNLRKSV